MSDYPDYEGQKSAVFLIPQWAAKEATDVDEYETVLAGAAGTFKVIEYTVPTGKTLFIVQFGGGMIIDNAVVVKLALWTGVAEVGKAIIGGRGACGIPCPKPYKFVAGYLARVYVTIFAAGSVNGWFGGYLL